MAFDNSAENAIGFFSNNAQQFHGLYDTPEFRERLQLWHGLLDRYAQRDGLSVDMGCGSGILTFYLAQMGAQVIGIDGAPDMIAFCKAEQLRLGVTNAQFFQAQLPNVDVPDLTAADLIISSSVIEYVEDLGATLELFNRLLKPGGTLIVSMPNLASLARWYQRLRFKITGKPEVYRDIRHFSSPASLAHRVAPFGLRLVEAHYYTHFTRLAKAGRRIGLPEALTEDLFVAVFQRTARQ